MKIDKKNYETPRLMVHGTVGELTLKGGGGVTDVPIGTSVSVAGGVTGITGTHP